MSSAPPPSGSRPLAAELIRLAGNRARILHQVVGDRASARQGGLEPPASTSAVGPDPAADPATDVDVVRVDPVDSMYPIIDDPELPPPTLTNTNLRHYLAAAMETQPGFGAADQPTTGGVRSRLRRMIGAPRQAEFNAAVLHVLHQLDHRGRQQERRIVTLEARLAAARRPADAVSAPPGDDGAVVGDLR
ncbi:MAG: hypothetical protein AAFN30_03905 [Actinomycetota bacterium]